MLKRFSKRLRLPILLLIAILLATVVLQTNVHTIAADNSFTFAVTSDMQGHSGSTHDSSIYFRGVCEKIAALGEAAFMVSPGDLDPPSDVDFTIRKYLGQDYLWYPGVGNHDEETPSEMTWLRAYNYDLNGPGAQPDIFHTGPLNGVETNYSFDYGNSHFVMLNEYYDGNSDTGTDGDVVDALYNWLASDLNATDKAHIFVFGHEPSYPQPDADNGVLRHLGDSLDKYPAHRDRFWTLLRDKNVVAYFHGHTHSYSAVKTNGVWELDSGHSQGTGETGTPSTFLMVHINGDTVTFDAYRLNGGIYTNNHSGTLTEDPAPSTIAVTDFANYRVFQRGIGGTSKSITISGIYSNMDWNHVDARILQHGTDTAVVDWTPIDTTPGGGIFSGSLIVPQGGWYNIEVRALDSAGSVLGSNRGVNKWGVGMVILCIGQSNMVGHGQQPFTAASSDLAVNYSNAGVWEHLADPYDDGSPQGAVDNDNSTAGGSMIPALANSLLQTFDFPIAFVPSAKDGSNLYSQWAYRNTSNHFDTTTLYGQSITKARNAGGVELIIMHQGEADTNAHRTEAQYEADFTTLIGHYREDLYAGIPIFFCQLGTIDLIAGDARTNADVQAVRNAQHDLNNGTSIFMAATAMDQPRLDEVHYTRPGLDVIGERMAQAIKYYLGVSSYYRGPAIASASFAGNRSTIDVQIVQIGGNDFTPVSGITGFSVLSSGSPVGISSVLRNDANHIRLTLITAIPQGATATLRYLWGADPDNTRLVKDNSSLALPLENTTTDIVVTDTNKLPVAVGDSYTINEDGILMVNASGVLVNDSDANGDPLTAIKVTNPTHGNVTLNTNGSFTYTPNANYNGSDSFTYKANDGQADSNTATVAITINPVNDPPVAVNDSYTTNKDTTLTVGASGILSNDSDVEGSGLTAVLVGNVSHGSLTLNSNGSLTYTPATGYTGTDTLTYKANDGQADSNIATVNITVTVTAATFGLNGGNGNILDIRNRLDAMRFQNTAGSGNITKLELLLDDPTASGKARLGVYADNSGKPGNLLLDAGEVNIVNGWISRAGLNLTVTSNSYYWLVFVMNDGNYIRRQSGQPSGSHYYVSRAYGTLPASFPTSGVASNTSQYVMRATVTPGGNTPPVAINDAYSMNKDNILNTAVPGVLGNDTDANVDQITAVLVNNATSGNLTLNGNGSFTYIPNAGYIGTDSFTYKANDGKADSNTATVSITVNRPNNAPVAVNNTYTTDEDTMFNIAAPGLLGNDSDADGDPLTAVKLTNPAHGAVTLNVNGSFTYTPNANYNGSDSFTYKANDGQADSNTATVAITINPVNDPPVAVNDSYTTNKDTTLTVGASGILSNDSDVEGSGLTAVLVGNVSHGSLTLNSNGSLTYMPATGYTGTDTLTYKANDGQADSNIATVAIQVTAQTTPSSSLSFGGNDYVTFGDLDLTGSFTIEFWMKANSKTGWASVIMKNTDYGLEFDTQGRLSTSLYNGDTWNGYIFYTGITTGQWHHIAMVWDEVGNDLYLYVDGVMAGSDLNLGNHQSNNNPLRIGAWNTSSEYFNGLIDEVRISNIVRYTSNFTPPTTLLQADSSTVALWHLDEATGQTVNDSSGHGSNGVLGSSTAVQSSDPAWSSDSPINK